MVSERWKFRILIIILNLIFIPSCSVFPSTESSGITNKTLHIQTKNPESIFDTGFLSGTPCSAPCILNSTPGITKKEKVIENLKALNIFPECTDIELNYEGGSVISCEPGFSFWFNDKDLSQVFIDTFEEISISQVINIYGDPESVNIFREGTSHSTLTKYIVYDGYNFVLLLNDPKNESNNSENFDIKPEMNIYRILYEDDETIKTFDDNCSIPWKGYGTYLLNSGC